MELFCTNISNIGLLAESIAEELPTRGYIRIKRRVDTTNISVMKSEMPGANQRIKELVDIYAQGNVSRFVRLLHEAGHEVSQQKFNRIFNIDTRTDKWPGVPTDVIKAIIAAFPEVSYSWLLTGEGQMKEELIEYDAGAAIRKIEATTAVILAAAAEILAKVSSQSVTVLRDQLEDAVRKRLSS
jgi:hypothetical protein